MEWGGDVKVGDYRLEVRATAEGLLGTLQFSALVRANCVPGASGHPNADLADFGQAIESDDDVAVCGHSIADETVVNGVIPNDEDGESPLHVAAANNASMVTRLLLALGAEVEAQDFGGWTPLHWAADGDGNVVEVARALLDAGADPNVQGADGQAPLHWAVDNADEKEDVVELLLQRGALVNLRDTGGDSALDFATAGRKRALAEKLRESGGVCFSSYSSRRRGLCGLYLWPQSAEVSVTFGETKAIYTLTLTVRSSAEVDFAPIRGNAFSLSASGDSGASRVRAVVYATAPGLRNAGGLLVSMSSGAQVLTMSLNVTVGLGTQPVYPPLFLALTAAAGHSGVAGILPPPVEGVGMSYRSGSGEGVTLIALPTGTALSLVSSLPAGGTTTTVTTTLIRHGYFPAAFTVIATIAAVGPFPAATKEVTAYHAGAIHQFNVPGFRHVRYSLTAGGNKFAVSSGGAVSPGGVLSEKGEYEVAVQAVSGEFWGRVFLTLSLSVLPCSRDSSESEEGADSYLDRKLFQAATNGDVECVGAFILQGANSSGVTMSHNEYWPHRTHQGVALHWAAYGGHLEVVKYMVSVGVDAETVSNHGWTPLHWAARTGKLDVVQYLVSDAGVDADATDNDGRSPLSFAARYGNLSVVQYLAPRADVDENAVDSTVFGMTPGNWAGFYHHYDVLEYLNSLNS